jgi:hypothetical protein
MAPTLHLCFSSLASLFPPLRFFIFWAVQGQGMGRIADLFDAEVIDGKTLALMEKEYLTDPAPEVRTLPHGPPCS